MALPPGEIRYEKTTSFATTKGQQYEVKLSALLFLRGIDSGLDFQLATNVDGAGALDDIVYRFKRKSNSDAWTSYFIQLKHLEHKGVNRAMLTGRNGKFSLLKYFEAYEDIKQAMTATSRKVLFDGDIRDSSFVIFTNARPNPDLGEESCSAKQINELLGSNSGKVFTFNPDGDSEAEKAVVDSLRGCVDGGKDFLKRLFIFAAQPSEAKFDELIKNELRQVSSKVGNIDVDRLFVCFMENVKSWWEDKKYVLDRGSDLLAIARDRVLAETGSLLEVNANKLDLVFEESALKPLRDVLGGAFPVIHVVSSEKTSRVTCTKLLQISESSTYLFLGSERLLSIREAVLAVWEKGRYKTLIVSVSNRDSLKDTNHFEKVLVELSQIAVVTKKRLVILTDEMIAPANGSKQIKDTFEFSSLTPETRNSFLATEFKLQDRPISLQTFFGDFTEFLPASLVEEIMKTGSMFVSGAALPEHDKHYIPRCLEPPGALSLFRWPSDTAVVLNVQQSDIVDIFLQLDRSLRQKSVLKTLNDNLGSLFPEPTGKAIFIGDSFPLGTFECNYLGTVSDKVSALQFRPSQSHMKTCPALNHGWVVHSFQETSLGEVAELVGLHSTVHLIHISNNVRTMITDSEYKVSICHNIQRLRPKTALDIEERTVIVSGEPGMGKTSLLTHLGKSTKEAHPQIWVILISLNEHSQLFSEGKHEDAIGFLLAAAGITQPLDQAMFKFALEVAGNVVVLMDGFDEIAPTYENHCCRLLSNLLETRTQKIWVTTRTNVTSKLESHLSTSAVSLCKFDEEDQRFYLKRYWQDAAMAAGKEVLPEMDEFITRLLQMTIPSMRDWGDDILDVPLHVQMIAEVFVEDVIQSSTLTLPKQLDWLECLDLFIEKKIVVYVQDKLKIKPSDTNYAIRLNRSRSAYLTNHMDAAFNFMYPKDYVEEMQSKNLIGDVSGFLKQIESGEEKTGSIDRTINGKAHFVHRVFAEYFVAKWFASNLSEYAKFIEKEISYEYCAVNVIAPLLCDLILAKGLALHTAVLKGDLERVTTLLTEGADVNAKDVAGRTPLHLTAVFGFMGRTQARDVAILDLLIQNPLTDLNVKDDLLKGTPLRYADVSQHWLMIERLLTRKVDSEGLLTTTLRMQLLPQLQDYILSNDSEKLFEFCINSDPDFFKRPKTIIILFSLPHLGNGVLANACLYGNRRIVQLLVNRGYDLNGPSPSTLLTPLHCASLGGHLEIVKNLVNASKSKQTGVVTTESHPEATQGICCPENPSSAELDFVNGKSAQGQTALHLASKYNHHEIVSFLIEHGADPASRDSTGRTCLHLSAAEKHPDTLKVILGAVNDSDSLAFVNTVDRRGDTALHLAIEAGCLDSVRSLVSAARTMAADSFEQTPLMLAAKKGNLDIVKCIVASLDQGFNGDTSSRAEWIDLKDMCGQTALGLAATYGFENVVAFLAGLGADLKEREAPYINIWDYSD